MAPHCSAARGLCVLFLLFLSVATFASAAASSSESPPLCALPSPAPERLASKGDALALLNSFQLNAGYFFGGEDIHFADDDGNASYVTRSFSLFPHSVDSTTDHDLVHVAATLALSGARARTLLMAHGRPHRYVGGHTVTFYLDGYHSCASGVLCMTGSGTYPSDDGSINQLGGVALKLRVPCRSKLSDPFVTGRLQGASFGPISLVAYAEGAYDYNGKSGGACRPPQESSSSARGAHQALGGGNFSCARLKERLVSSYKLQYVYGGASGSSPPAGLQARRMHVGEVQCTELGEVRAYAVLSNDTEGSGRRWQREPHPPFMPGEEVVVAEGRWDASQSMLCLSACRVVRAGPAPSLDLKVTGCGIGMGFWFPGAWTIRDRSAVAGMLWNSSDDGSGVISASSIDADIHRGNFSEVEYDYNYTMVEEARKHYLNNPELSDLKKKANKAFVSPNYTSHDLEFHFSDTNRDTMGSGDAYPVTIGSAMVYGDRLAADDSFSSLAVIDTRKNELINVSYDIRRHVPQEGWVRPKNNSFAVTLVQHQITAEGVFDPKTGVMCMMACRERNATTDCQILVTVHFASLDAKAGGHGTGAISSLRNKTTDPLFFEKIDIRVYGMYSEQVAESVSRMDLESVLLVVSTTLPCVFAVLQILHARRHPEASAATSITMLVVVALGYVAPLVVSSEALFLSRVRQYELAVPFRSFVPYELSQAMMRAPTLIALLLHLRLIQLAWSARREAADADGSKAGASSSAAAAERRALWLCLPLYLIGGALTVVVHAVNARRAEGSLTVRIGPGPPTLWEDLVSSGGLALDAFLLPQVAMNAFSAGAGVGALSPWFYVGGTVVRAMPHAYDVVRSYGYVPSLRPSYIYASPRYDRFGVTWDVVVPCAAALLAVLLFLQQRVRVAAPLFGSRRRLGQYEMVSPL